MSTVDFAPIIIGIAGGSGSGKTSISDAVVNRIGNGLVSKITHDSYYRDLGHLSFDERKCMNFDHPDSLETELLIEDIKKLKRGETIGAPVYDFTTHTRRPSEKLTIIPTPVIVLDGILIFSDPELRDLVDIKVFVDTDPDIRFIRRLKRDTNERGRTPDEVAEQYLSTVRPMHIQFVEPSKRFADIIIPEGGYDSYIAMDLLIAHMQHAINKAGASGETVDASVPAPNSPKCAGGVAANGLAAGGIVATKKPILKPREVSADLGPSSSTTTADFKKPFIEAALNGESSEEAHTGASI